MSSDSAVQSDANPLEDHQHSKMQPVKHYLAHGLAGGLCCQATHTVVVPMDVVKTRLQTNPGMYTGVGHAARSIVQSEGASALLLGLTPTFLGYMGQGAFKFGLNAYLLDVAKNKLGKKRVEENKLVFYMGCSAVAETVGTIFLCPFEALRIRQVSDVALAKFSSARAMFTLMQEGAEGTGKSWSIAPLYKGLFPILLKQLPYTMTQLTVFSLTLEYFYKSLLPKISTTKSKKDDLSTNEQLGVSLVIGAFAGVCSAIASHPSDTVLSFINTKEHKGKPMGQALKAVLGDIAKQPSKMWLGVGPRAIMVATYSAFQFLIYDTVKVMCGLPTSGH